MNSGGGSGAGSRDRTTSAAHTDRPFLLHPECGPTDWYIGEIPSRHARRPGPLPPVLPSTTAELLAAGQTHRTIAKTHVRAEYGMYVPVDQLLPGTTDTGWTRARRIPAATLALAHLLRHPRRVATGFGAAALYGMAPFVDEELLEFLVPAGTSRTHAPEHAVLSPTRQLENHRSRAWVFTGAPEPLGTLRFADPGTTLWHMLRVLAVPDPARDRRWRVPDMSEIRPGFTREFLRGVQVSDAFHQARGRTVPMTTGQLRVPAGVDATFGARVLGYTDVGAESPPETLLRLAVSDLAPGLRSQIPVWKDDGRRLLTSCDLGWEDRRVFLFYDGAHHLQRTQRNHDSKVLAALQRNGGRVLRPVADDVADAAAVRALRERVTEALA